ncbi:MAG: hypothetical protein R2822_11680 [Spirosomataceae bacterium]
MTTSVRYRDTDFSGRKGVVGIIGAGNFLRMTLLPTLKGKTIKYSKCNGLSGTALAKKHNIAISSTTDYQDTQRR